MVAFLYVVTLLSTTVGAFVMLVGSMRAISAPQEAAAAAFGIGLAVIPYVFTRCVQISNDRNAQAAALKRITELLEAQATGGSPPPRQDVR